MAELEQTKKPDVKFYSITSPDDVAPLAFDAAVVDENGEHRFKYRDIAFIIRDNGKIEYLEPEDNKDTDNVNLNNLKDGLIACLVKRIRVKS